MKPTVYVLLLRGINVGGNQIIRMADLKEVLSRTGLMEDVETYIQSGNVLFTTTQTDRKLLSDGIAQALKENFGYQSGVFLFTSQEVDSIISSAPQGFGSSPDLYRYDVIYLDGLLDADDIEKLIPIRQGVDQLNSGNKAIYFSRLISEAGKSYLSKIVSLPFYKSVTVRNWNTTVKLQVLAKGKITHD